MPLLSLALATLLGVSQVRFPHPERVRYDGQCFTINGKDTFVYSGAFHYFRCPKELWPDRFQKIKDAGFNTVETYVAWNLAEPSVPRNENDFSKIDLKDLDDWLTMATERYGLNVIARPGPYICAEWDAGGFPYWLIAKKPSGTKRRPWLRSDDPEYLRWVRHYMRAVAPVIARHQITRKPAGKAGVILFQIENEYDYIGGGDAVHVAQLKELAKDAQEGGIDVPLVSCWTRQVRGSQDPLLSQVMDCPNLYPRYGVTGTKSALQEVKRAQPQAPIMVMELQGGWFSEVGGKLAEDQEGIDARQINQLTLFCIQNGMTAMNYYMLFGGTNFGLMTPPNITTSYDYFAPIREDGSLGSKYAAVRAIGEFLKEHGARLARSTASPEKGDSDSRDIELALRTTVAGDRYVFVRNTSRTIAHRGTASIAGLTIPYDLESFGMKVLHLAPGAKEGTWWPKPAEYPAKTPVAATIRFSTAERWAERLSNPGRRIRSDVPLVRLGVLDARYVGYIGRFRSPKSASLWLRQAGGDAVVEVDGVRLRSGQPFAGGQVFSFSSATDGEHRLQVLYENPGAYNFGGGLEDPRGVLEARVLTEKVSVANLDQWQAKLIEDPKAAERELANEEGWRSVTLEAGRTRDLAVHATEIYRTTISSKDATTLLHIDAVDDDAWIYLDGRLIGESHQWDRPIDLDLRSSLASGNHTLAIVARNNDGTGGLSGVPTLRTPLPKGSPVNLNLVDALDGPKQASEAYRLDAKTPIARKVSGPTAVPGGVQDVRLGSWYRLNFNLPAEKGQHPTRGLRLKTFGNGLIYLNGRPLGRIWNVGPQREYYLPEPWLRYGGKNEVTVFLRDMPEGEALQAAEVGAFTQERRPTP